MSPGTRAEPHAQRSAQPEREHGIVVRRIDKKGFAFIRAESGTEYFFHLSDCVGDGTWNRLEEGTGVSFVATTTNKGPRASFVKVR
jgi:cold shock CspA family protein